MKKSATVNGSQGAQARWLLAYLLAGLAISQLLAVPSASAAGCMWVVAGRWVLGQDNGYTVVLELQQNNLGFTGQASLHEGGSMITSGTGEVKGNIEDGNKLSFIIAWSNGSKGEYKGTIEINGTVRGTTVDVANPQSSASWSAAGLSCVPVEEPTTSTPESSAPPKRVRKLGKRNIQPAQKMATAIDDVDIYNGPGSEEQGFQIIGMLAAKSQVPVIAHQVGWYQLQVNVPGGSGWVAEDHLTVKP